MAWLATPMWIFLALGLLLGLFTGWWIWRRPPGTVNDDADKDLANLRARIEESDAEKNKLRAQLLAVETEYTIQSDAPVDDDTDPIFYESASDDNPDDLKKINGIGPQLEKMLNEMGVFYYHQIAAWTDGQAGKIDDRLRFKGRIFRDDWRAQASVLAAKR